MKTYKECSCCGGHAGYFEQWHNRDDGYGLCRSCADWLTNERGTSPEEMKRLYGKPGVHYEARTTCPHCARDLEGDELTTGLCTSDDCPRHDEGEKHDADSTATN